MKTKLLAVPNRLGWFSNRVLWFLWHPSLYPELARFVRGRIRSLFTRTAKRTAKEEAGEWCRRHSVDARSAILDITDWEDFQSLEDRFSEQLRESRERERRCPIQMGGPGNLELLYQMAEYTQAARVVETGVAYGWSSLALLLSITKRKESLLISTDMPRPGSSCEKYTGCVVPEGVRSSWKIIPRADREALPRALDVVPEFDLCHYDSDKNHEGRIWAYPKLWKALRPGGVFISDDIGDNMAFHDFCESIGQQPWIVESPRTDDGVKYVGVLIKRPAGSQRRAA